MEVFLTFNATWLWPWLGSSHMAYRHGLLIDPYLSTKFHSNRRNFLWTDGRSDVRTLRGEFVRISGVSPTIKIMKWNSLRLAARVRNSLGVDWNKIHRKLHSWSSPASHVCHQDALFHAHTTVTATEVFLLQDHVCGNSLPSHLRRSDIS